jgi:hypothetical protein
MFSVHHITNQVRSVLGHNQRSPHQILIQAVRERISSEPSMSPEQAHALAAAILDPDLLAKLDTHTRAIWLEEHRKDMHLLDGKRMPNVRIVYEALVALSPFEFTLDYIAEFTCLDREQCRCALRTLEERDLVQRDDEGLYLPGPLMGEGWRWKEAA